MELIDIVLTGTSLAICTLLAAQELRGFLEGLYRLPAGGREALYLPLGYGSREERGA